MPSFHAASIIASCVRTEYPEQSDAQVIPKRNPRIRGPESENNGDRLCADIESIEAPPGRDPALSRANVLGCVPTHTMGAKGE
jgi:hypothetical protein